MVWHYSDAWYKYRKSNKNQANRKASMTYSNNYEKPEAGPPLQNNKDL